VVAACPSACAHPGAPGWCHMEVSHAAVLLEAKPSITGLHQHQQLPAAITSQLISVCWKAVRSLCVLAVDYVT
jgi:hypothetical protein